MSYQQGDIVRVVRDSADLGLDEGTLAIVWDVRADGRIELWIPDPASDDEKSIGLCVRADHPDVTLYDGPETRLTEHMRATLAATDEPCPVCLGRGEGNTCCS